MSGIKLGMKEDNDSNSLCTNTHKIADEFTTQLVRAHECESKYLESVVGIVESEIPSQRFRVIDQKITNLTKLLKEVGCDSFKQFDIKNAINISIQTRSSVLKEIALLTDLADQCEALKSCAEKVEALFKLSFNSTRISQDYFACDMKALRHLKTKYTKLLETYGDLNAQVEEKSKDKRHIPDQQDLITCKKEIDRLRKQKSELEAQVNHYLGISQDTTSARNELDKIQKQIELADCQLSDCIGLDAWS